MRKIRSSRLRASPNIHVVGVGLGPDDLTPRQRAIIDGADILIGGHRLLDHFRECSAEKRTIGRDINETIAFLKERIGRKPVVVLASGDPLFFGIGARLVEAFGPERVTIHPNVSSVAAAFARIKEPWGGVRVFSLHGREPEAELLQALTEDDRIAVLTDPERSPAWLARLILNRQGEAFRMAVMQALGTAAERYGWYTLEQAATLKVVEPNVVVLKREREPIATRRPLRLGTPDEWFEHRKGLITKSEVRAVTLAKLRLGPGQVLWDLGAGSGSVAIEASLFIGNGRIVAVEKNPQRIEQIKANARRFGVRRLSVVQTELPDGLKGLPQPDRIFIGGGGKDFLPILSEAIRYLRPEGIVVINAVLLQNVHGAEATLRRLGFATEMVEVQIHRSQPMPYGERLEALNPVWIITGVRNSEGGQRRGEARRQKREFGIRKGEGGKERREK